MRKKFFETFACSVSELTSRDGGDDLMAFAAPRVSILGENAEEPKSGGDKEPYGFRPDVVALEKRAIK